MRTHRLITADKALRYAGLVGPREDRFGGVQAHGSTRCQTTDLLAKISFASANPWSPMKGGTP